MEYQIKDVNKKRIVELYQAQVQESIDKLKSTDGKMSSEMKNYIKALEENMSQAPVMLGYMQKVIKKKN